MLTVKKNTLCFCVFLSDTGQSAMSTQILCPGTTPHKMAQNRV